MKKSLKYSIVVIVIIVAILTTIIYYFNLQNQNELLLPVLSPTDVNPELVDKEVWKSGNHYIQDFELTDQNNELTTQDFVQDKIYVADFFFSTCQTICPIMTGQMSRVSKEFKNDPNIKFLSFTVLPTVDTPDILNAYAQKNKVDHDQWRMLTGAKSDIYNLARKSYFTLKEAEVGQGDGGDSDFIHTNNFVLIDKNNQIRGYYDGTSLKDMDRLIKDLKILRRD